MSARAPKKSLKPKNVPAVLVDTCAWIDFLRNKQGGLGDQVAQLVSDKKARLCGVIVTELLQGVKTEAEVSKLNVLFARISILPTLEEDWVNAGRALQALRAQGVTIPLTDALIASIARRNDIEVLTVDKHFAYLMP